MDFELTQEQKMIRDMVEDFAKNEIKPLAEKVDKEHYFPKETVAKLAELGLLGVAIPEEYGGAGMDNVCYVLALEAVSRYCGSTGVIMSVNNSLACDPVFRYGTEEQKKKFLTAMAKGERLGCLGLTEPNAGSDAANISTTAKLVGDEWIVNGTKLFITNGKEAGICVLIAQTDKSKKHKGIVALIVDMDNTPGFRRGKLEDKLGIRGSSTAELIFEDAKIPKKNQLGEVGEGFKVALSTLDGGRIGIAAQAIGLARGALEDSVEHAKTRVQFGKPIASLQAIQWMIADMATRIDAARLLALRAAFLKDNKQPYSKEAAMAKLFASETAMWATTKGIQIHGGYGYTTEYPVERYFRDAKITEIYEGTSEIQRIVIGRSIIRD